MVYSIYGISGVLSRYAWLLPVVWSDVAGFIVFVINLYFENGNKCFNFQFYRFMQFLSCFLATQVSCLAWCRNRYCEEQFYRSIEFKYKSLSYGIQFYIFMEYPVFGLTSQWHGLAACCQKRYLRNGAIWRGFKYRQHEVVFGVILVPQNNTILCANII